jgi:hypothetical protein
VTEWDLALWAVLSHWTPWILGSEGPAELGSSRDRLSGGSSLPLSLFPPSEPHFGSLLASLLESGASR